MVIYCPHNLRCAIKAPGRGWVVRSGVSKHVFESTFARLIFARSLESEIKRDLRKIQESLNSKERTINHELALLQLPEATKH
jgi:ribosomal protein RSM22 (predicted rRNA methylase)